MKILSIESSCDETAAAIVEDGTKVLSSVVASSKDFHEATGGIVPEIAARKQTEFIVPVIDQTLKKYGNEARTLDAVAVTIGPGLIGSLLVGIEAAKALAAAWNKPLVPVNHLIGHIYGNFVANSDKIEFPALVLVVSGGHTDFVLMRNHGDLEYLGGTVDDAAGEAFDKTARLLGLAKYLGGIQLSQLAATCTENHALGVLPRPMVEQNNFDVSFSGLKTAVKNLIAKNVYDNASIACEFENAVLDVLVEKSKRAIKRYKPKTLMMGGGVSANVALRTRMENLAKDFSLIYSVPPINLCTDNAIYIASAAFYNYKPESIENVTAIPSLNIMDTF